MKDGGRELMELRPFQDMVTEVSHLQAVAVQVRRESKLGIEMYANDGLGWQEVERSCNMGEV